MTREDNWQESQNVKLISPHWEAATIINSILEVFGYNIADVIIKTNESQATMVANMR